MPKYARKYYGDKVVEFKEKAEIQERNMKAMEYIEKKRDARFDKALSIAFFLGAFVMMKLLFMILVGY